MPYLNNKKFSEIRKAAGDGNEKAKMVLQALRKGTQDDLDRLVGDYYSVPQQEPAPLENIDNVENVNEAENVNNAPEIVEAEPVQQAPVEEQAFDSIPVVEDLTDVLDKETDGLFDENEIEQIDFAKFLGNKRRDGIRAKKNAEYFNAFNPESRANYIEKKKNDYKAKFGDSLHDIDRQFNDYDKSIDRYTQGVGDMLDDEKELDVDVMGNAYDEITDNNGIMHSFGRFWDDVDTGHVVDDLKVLVDKYGKKNILAALNVLKTDNANFRDYRLGQINEEVERYNKSLDKILK